jgi:hypothetical protein
LRSKGLGAAGFAAGLVAGLVVVVVFLTGGFVLCATLATAKDNDNTVREKIRM